MDGSGMVTTRARKGGGRTKYRSRLKSLGLNEHHRQPRSKNGGRQKGDLNISKVGVRIHQSFHALFGTLAPSAVCLKINQVFESEPEYLVPVDTKDFSTFHRYFTNCGVLPLKGMAGHGLTWGHLFLHGNQEDLNDVFRGGRHYFTKPDPDQALTCRYEYLFGQPTMQVMAFELTKHWLPLSVVIVAIKKEHQEAVRNFLDNLIAVKKRR